jgi:hypothetical protein
MTYADYRRPPPSRRRRPPMRRRRRAWPWVLLLLLILGVLAYLLFTPQVWDQLAATAEESEPAVAEPVDVTVDELLDRAVDNGDGTMTVTVTEGEVGGLVRDGLQSGSAPMLRDVTVDLQRPDGSAPGQMTLRGRLPDQNVPVTVLVDLSVNDQDVQPTVRDVRLGPLPVPSSMRDDLTQQLRQVSLLGGQNVAVEELRTNEQELVVTGSRR